MVRTRTYERTSTPPLAVYRVFRGGMLLGAVGRERRSGRWEAVTRDCAPVEELFDTRRQAADALEARP